MRVIYKKIIFFCIVLFLQTMLVYGSNVNYRETPVVKVVRENAEAVVNLSTERIVFLRGNPYWGKYGSEFDKQYNQFFNNFRPVQTVKLKSVGSGVVVNKKGIIVTNAHVVHMATNIVVIFNDGTSVEGKIVYEDTKADLALVKIISPKDLKEIALGNTDDVMIGETVVAIGNPLGLENSVTVGVVSGKDRTYYSASGQPVCRNLLQTDTPINPGNSGGVLLNLNGELIGISMAVVQNSQSIGFAIPVKMVKKVIEDYKQGKKTKIEDSRKSVFLKKIIKQGTIDTDVPHSPVVTMEEGDTGYFIRLKVEDLDKDKLNIEAKANSVTISGRRSIKSEETGSGTSYQFQGYSSFSRTIPFSQEVDPRAMKTEVEGDILRISLPKK